MATSTSKARVCLAVARRRGIGTIGTADDGGVPVA
jgi:hypothetical protein